MELVEKFELMLSMQLQLQQEHMKDGDPRYLDPDARATFMTWNTTAMFFEVGEAFNEVGWKPWATSRHIQHQAFIREMVDAWHFFMNLLIAGSGIEDMGELAAVFTQFYVEKNTKNAQRQIDGYDGVITKCSHCHRELSETDATLHVVNADRNPFCSKTCNDAYYETLRTTHDSPS